MGHEVAKTQLMGSPVSASRVQALTVQSSRSGLFLKGGGEVVSEFGSSNLKVGGMKVEGSCVWTNELLGWVLRLLSRAVATVPKAEAFSFADL